MFVRLLYVAVSSIKRQTQFWPITYGETLLFSLQEVCCDRVCCVVMVLSNWKELQPLVTVYRHDYLTEDEFDKSQKVCVYFMQSLLVNIVCVLCVFVRACVSE